MATPRRPPFARSRRSYFREEPMEEYTPANSTHELSLREGARGWGHVRFWTDGEGRLGLRLVNAVLHLGLCCVLLAIMAEFMVRYRGGRRRPQAVALVTLVAVDCGLDLYSVVRARRNWQGWALFFRLLLSLGYLAQFLLYVGFRKVLPRHYAFWGMDATYSEPVVYLLLWIIGVWNLLHTTIHRHTLGRDLRRYVDFIEKRIRRGDHVDSESPGDPSPFAVSRAASNRQGHGAEPEVPVALTEIHGDSKPRVTNLDSASFTSGESSQARTLAPTESRRPSRRTSTAISDGEGNDLARVDSKT